MGVSSSRTECFWLGVGRPKVGSRCASLILVIRSHGANPAGGRREGFSRAVQRLFDRSRPHRQRGRNTRRSQGRTFQRRVRRGGHPPPPAPGGRGGGPTTSPRETPRRRGGWDPPA